MTAVFTDTATAARDWLRNNAAALGIDADSINLGTKDITGVQIVVTRVGGGDDVSDAPLDQALLQIDVWGDGTDPSYNQARNVKNAVRALLKELRPSSLNTGTGATWGYGARVQSEIFLPDNSGGKSIPRFALTVEVTARANP